MEYLWVYVWSISLGVSVGVMPTALYILAKLILKPLKLWPWEYLNVWTDDTRTYVRTVQRKDLWFPKKP